MPKKTFEAAKQAQCRLIVQLKDNQPNLLREVSEGCEILTPESSYQSPLEKHHHRIERREVNVFDVTSCLIESAAWEPYVGCAIRVVRTTERLNSKTHLWENSVETAYYLGNAMYHADDAARAIREHWHTENRNHYVRDVSLYLENLRAI